MAQVTLPPAAVRWGARIALLLFAALMAWTVAIAARPVPKLGPPPPHAMLDSTLYQEVAERVATGEDYWNAAAAEHRERAVPLKPVVTVRPPLLAWLTAALGGFEGIQWALRAVALATLVAMALRLLDGPGGTVARVAACGLAAISVGILTMGVMALLHDIWAGLLVTLAIMLRRPDHYAASLIVATLAVCLRELVAPVMLVMGAAALIEGRRREASAWGLGLAVSIAFLLWHWHRVTLIALPGDVESVGWSAMLGWPNIIRITTNTSALAALPVLAGGILTPVALFGWAGVERGLALRACLWLWGMTIVLMVFGRINNLYWGGLIAPMLAVGVAFAPRAFAQLVRAAR